MSTAGRKTKRFNERKTAEIAYWKEKLSKINGKYRRETIEALNNSAAATFAENITGQRYTALNTVAIACNINTAGVLYTCLSLLLHYITGRENVLIAASVTDRSSERTRRLIGRLVSGIYLYRSLRPQATIKEHIAEIYVDLLRSCRHSISNHEMLGINESALRANCDLFLNFEKKLSVETSCSVVKTGHQQEHGAYYALSCTITEFNDGLSLRWKYSHACYDQRRIEHISQRNNQILDYMSAYPQHSVGDMFRHLRLHKL